MAEEKVREDNIAENLSFLVKISKKLSQTMSVCSRKADNIQGLDLKKISWVGSQVWLPLPLENNGIL